MYEIAAHFHSIGVTDLGIPDYPGSWVIECCAVGLIKGTQSELVAAWNQRSLSERGLP